MLLSYTRKFDPDEGQDQEGLMYDLEKARELGLYETITFDPDQLFERVHANDVSANLPPNANVSTDICDEGHPTDVTVTYAYHYGFNPVTEISHDGFGHTTVN